MLPATQYNGTSEPRPTHPKVDLFNFQPPASYLRHCGAEFQNFQWKQITQSVCLRSACSEWSDISARIDPGGRNASLISAGEKNGGAGTRIRGEEGALVWFGNLPQVHTLCLQFHFLGKPHLIITSLPSCFQHKIKHPMIIVVYI